MSSRKKNVLQLTTGALGCLGVIGTFGYMVIATGQPAVPDEFGCFAEVPQPITAVIVDVSGPRWDVDQQRSILTYDDRLYDRLGFNERLAFYTTEGAELASVPRAKFHVCGQASHPEQLEKIGATPAQAGYLTRQKDRLYEEILKPQIEDLFSLTPDEDSLQLWQSPMLEMIANVARVEHLKAGDRLIVISDLIQNSESARFCTVRGDMPPFEIFKQREIYTDRLAPPSLEGVTVEALMLIRYGYGEEPLEYCRSEEEVRAFFRDYFIENGVSSPVFTRLRQAGGQ